MLQIISGKFFKSKRRYRYEGRGVLFGTYRLFWPIETCVATLEPVDVFGSVASYVVSYVNQIERPAKNGPGTLLRTGDWEIVEQFRIFCILGLQAFFHQSREAVAMASRRQPLSMSDRVPRLFVPRFFESPVQGTSKEARSFSVLVKKVIGLPRDTYRAVLAAAKAFADALEITGDSIDLAYSLLVFSLECLSQAFDCYEPAWEDYPHEVAEVLDPILMRLDASTARGIRRALLREKNLKVGRRFVDFVTDHVQASFFLDEVPQGHRVVSKSELARALRNAYTMRSRYTHRLQPVHELIRTSAVARGEVILWKHEPYLTLAGLVRVARHVICSFVSKQESVDSEDIDWRSKLPGIIHVPMAPQYWISQHENFRPTDATRKLEGFLQEAEEAHISSKPLTNLQNLMKVYESTLPNVTGLYRLRMFALYCIYKLVVEEGARTEDSVTVIAENKDLLASCSIEAMLVLLILGKEWPWDRKELARQWRKYMEQKYHRLGLSIPPAFEILMQAEIARAYLETGSTQRYSMWLGRALLDAAGRPALQTLLRDSRMKKTAFPRDQFWEAAREDLASQG